MQWHIGIRRVVEARAILESVCPMAIVQLDGPARGAPILHQDEWDLFSIDQPEHCASDASLGRARALGIDVAYNEDGALSVPMVDDELAQEGASDIDAAIAYLVVTGGQLVQLPDDVKVPKYYRWYPVLLARDCRRFRHRGASDKTPLGGGMYMPSHRRSDTYLGSLFGYRFDECEDDRDDRYLDLYLRVTNDRDYLGVRWGNQANEAVFALASDFAATVGATEPMQHAYNRAKQWALLRDHNLRPRCPTCGRRSK